jgi:segregation and condensation protein B
MLMREDIKAAIEAILFVRAEPVELNELLEILELPAADVKEILEELIEEYNSSKRGLQIVMLDRGYLICTRPEYGEILAKMGKAAPRRLSTAAMETLAIIAYRQPVSRSEIENIRGVKSERVIASLLEKGLIEELGVKPAPGKPMLYGTTSEFLRMFQLSSLKDLPRLEED